MKPYKSLIIVTGIGSLIIGITCSLGLYLGDLLIKSKLQTHYEHRIDRLEKENGALKEKLIQLYRKYEK